MSSVRAKKYLGQHFLTDKNIAEKIVDSLLPGEDFDEVLEIGPGMGVLTDFLIAKDSLKLCLIDLDAESVDYLHKKYPGLKEDIIHGDFLKFDIASHFAGQVGIIGNFPYNISSQILFQVLQFRHSVPQVVGMFQKEVAERVAAPSGNKQYGILSVLVQAFYTVEYLFTVPPSVFNPPPKVQSGVIRLKRKTEQNLGCDEALFFRVVKAAFNQRRKTLRNALAQFQPKDKIDAEVLQLRAERLSVADFVDITRKLEPQMK